MGNVDGLIIDLSVIIRAQAAIVPPRKTFSDFSSLVLKNIEKTAANQDVKRIDIVADQYSSRSIKFHSRTERKGNNSAHQIEF